MSQKKVDAYKQEKANREKIIKREKRILMLEKLAALVVCLAAVCWIGFSVYTKVTEDKEVVTQNTVMDTTALDDYLSSLTAEAETEETAETETTAEAETEETAEAETEETAEAETEATAEAETEETAEAETEATAETEAEE